MQTSTVEDYLKAIYELQGEKDKAFTTVLAKRLNVKPASVTDMIRRLNVMQLVEYVPYQSVALTSEGARIAVQVIRRHELTERYFIRALDLPLEQAHQAAEQWEHLLSTELEWRMAAFVDKLAE